MVAENKSGVIQDDISSLSLMESMTDKEKLEVSKLFTQIFYSFENSKKEEKVIRKPGTPRIDP